MKFPNQPVYANPETGVVRFQENKVVRYLLDKGEIDLNHLWVEVATGRLPVEDYAQLMQLIGYSVSGYGDLAYSQEDKGWRRNASRMDTRAAQVYAAWQEKKVSSALDIVEP